MQTTPDAIDTSSYTHLLVRYVLVFALFLLMVLGQYAYANVGTDGTVTLSADQQANLLVMQGRVIGGNFSLYLAGKHISL